jgi:RsiW-degrading membrane proteinase PrsW (M82 family)
MLLLGIILGLLPSFAWIFFYLNEDLHPEPRRLLVLTFLSGAVFAFAALFFQIAVGCNLFFACPPGEIVAATFSLLPLLVFAASEEIAKFAAAYFSVHRNPAFDEPVDAMIYMVVAAMGFAAVENLGAIGSLEPAGTALIAQSFETTLLRFIGATLLHSLASGIVGYYWAVGLREFGAKKPILFGLFLATILHAAFNYLILFYEQLTYSVILLAIAGFFVLGDFEKLKRKPV